MEFLEILQALGFFFVFNPLFCNISRERHLAFITATSLIEFTNKSLSLAQVLCSSLVLSSSLFLDLSLAVTAVPEPCCNFNS